MLIIRIILIIFIAIIVIMKMMCWKWKNNNAYNSIGKMYLMMFVHWPGPSASSATLRYMISYITKDCQLLPIPDAESLPLYRMVLKLACHYNSKTKNNSNHSDVMRIMHIIGSEKIIAKIHFKQIIRIIAIKIMHIIVYNHNNSNNICRKKK